MISHGFHWIGSGGRPTPPAGGPIIFEVLAATGTRVTFATSRHSARLTPPRRATLASLSRAHCPSSRRQFYFAKWARQRRRLAERSGRITFPFGAGLDSRHGFVTERRTDGQRRSCTAPPQQRKRARARTLEETYSPFGRRLRPPLTPMKLLRRERARGAPPRGRLPEACKSWFLENLSCFGPFGNVPVRKNAFGHLCETGVAHLSPDTPSPPRETRRTAPCAAERRKKTRFWKVWEAGRPRGPQHFLGISFTSP